MLIGAVFSLELTSEVKVITEKVNLTNDTIAEVKSEVKEVKEKVNLLNDAIADFGNMRGNSKLFKGFSS